MLYLFKKLVELRFGDISLAALVTPALQRLEHLREGRILFRFVRNVQRPEFLRFAFAVPRIHPVAIQLKHGLRQLFLPSVADEINVIFSCKPVQRKTAGCNFSGKLCHHSVDGFVFNHQSTHIHLFTSILRASCPAPAHCGEWAVGRATTFWGCCLLSWCSEHAIAHP